MEKTTKCQVCGEEFTIPPALHSMDVGKAPPTCGSKPCRTNWAYRERTRNMQTGDYTPIDKINKL